MNLGITDFLVGNSMAHHVTFGDFMAGNFLAGDFLGGYQYNVFDWHFKQRFNIGLN